MKLFIQACLFVSFSVFATGSFAQESNREKAKARFAEGSKAYSERSYERALLAFQESYELSGESGLLYNIATCQQELRQYAAAIKSYEEFVAAQPKHPKRKEVEKTLIELREIVARKQLTIKAKVPGQAFKVDVFVAGQRFACETTPCQLAGVPAGNATLRITGSMEIEKSVSMPDGNATVTLEKKKNWPAYTALGFLGASAIAAPLGFLTNCDDICKGIAVGTGIPMLGFGLAAMIYPSERALLSSPDTEPKPSIRDRLLGK
jgi:tetratricopeptide (TPR) repeat protein